MNAREAIDWIHRNIVPFAEWADESGDWRTAIVHGSETRALDHIDMHGLLNALPVLERAVAERDEARAKVERLRAERESMAAKKPMDWHSTLSCPVCGQDQHRSAYYEHSRACANGLRAERDAKLRARLAEDIDDGLADWNEQIRRQRDEARAEVERLRGLLQPLALVAKHADDTHAKRPLRDCTGLWTCESNIPGRAFSLTIGHARAARAALEEAE